MSKRRPVKLLVVDDEPGIIDFITKIFKAKGFITFGATDGKLALEIFKKEKPQICIVDIKMPYSPISGLDTIRKIKELLPKTKVIALTATNDPRKHQVAEEFGVDEIVEKPIENQVLEDKIEIRVLELSL